VSRGGDAGTATGTWRTIGEEKCYDPRSCPRPDVARHQGARPRLAAKKSVATARRANRCGRAPCRCKGTAPGAVPLVKARRLVCCSMPRAPPRRALPFVTHRNPACTCARIMRWRPSANPPKPSIMQIVCPVMPGGRARGRPGPAITSLESY